MKEKLYNIIIIILIIVILIFTILNHKNSEDFMFVAALWAPIDMGPPYYGEFWKERAGPGAGEIEEQEIKDILTSEGKNTQKQLQKVETENPSTIKKTGISTIKPGVISDILVKSGKRDVADLGGVKPISSNDPKVI